METKIKRIKDNITPKDFKHLVNYLKADENIRVSRKDRLLKAFHLLYATGLRVNELQQLSQKMIIELLENRKLKVIAHKQKIEKYIYISEDGKKILSKVFDCLEPNDDYIFTSERTGANTQLAVNSMIRDINSYLHLVFPHKNVTSHSFRQTLITELASNNVNTKVIQSLIGHKSINSTYRYIKPSETDLLNSLEGVR